MIFYFATKLGQYFLLPGEVEKSLFMDGHYLRRGAGSRGHAGRAAQGRKSGAGGISREGFTTKRVPTEHAGGKWRLNYQSYTGQSGNLEVDLNFMFSQPLLQWKALNVKRHKGLG